MDRRADESGIVESGAGVNKAACERGIVATTL